MRYIGYIKKKCTFVHDAVENSGCFNVRFVVFCVVVEA